MAIATILIIVVGILIFNYLLGRYFYSKIKCYYEPLYFKRTKDGPLINVADLYPEFCLIDKLSYTRFMISFTLWVPLRMLIQIIIAVVLNLHMRLLIRISKKHDAIPEERERFARAVKRGASWFMKVNGIRVINVKMEYEAVYKKYLGDDYKMDINDKDYAVITCNHTGFYVSFII